MVLASGNSGIGHVPINHPWKGRRSVVRFLFGLGEFVAGQEIVFLDPRPVFERFLEHPVALFGDLAVDVVAAQALRHERLALARFKDGRQDLEVARLAPGDALALPGPRGYERVLSADRIGGGAIKVSRAFAGSQDWSDATGLSFWLYGRRTRKPIEVTLRDNRSPESGPAGWRLAWRDEFSRRAGTPPDPTIWGHEVGDGSVNGIPGWGNSELRWLWH